MMSTCKVTESKSTAANPVLVSKQHILRPAEMAEPEDQGGFNQADGKILRVLVFFFHRDAPDNACC